MAFRSTIFFISLFFSIVSKAQTDSNIQLLKVKIQTADSAELISHKITDDYAIKGLADWDVRDTSMNLKKWEKQNPPSPKFLENGKLNREIIIESRFLNDSIKNNLLAIIIRKVLIDSLVPTTCDQPQHLIIIYKNNRQSFIDICFGCRRIHTSKDIDFSEFYMDQQKWNDLEIFFKKNGLIELFKETEN